MKVDSESKKYYVTGGNNPEARLAWIIAISGAKGLINELTETQKSSQATVFFPVEVNGEVWIEGIAAHWDWRRNDWDNPMVNHVRKHMTEIPWTGMVMHPCKGMYKKTDFRPFDKVLVRDRSNEEWIPEFFAKFNEGESEPFEVVGGLQYRMCVPYKGNEYKAYTKAFAKLYKGNEI